MVELPEPNEAAKTSKLVTVSGTSSALAAVKGHGPLQLSAAGRTAPNAWLLLRALRKRLLPALVIGVLVGSVFGTVVWFVMPPPKKTVRSLLQMEAVQPKVFFDTKAQQSFELYQRSQIAFVKSRFVLSKALGQKADKAAGLEEINKLKVIQDELADSRDPLQWMEAEIKVDFALGPELMRISMEGHDPEPLKHIINAVTKAYLDEVVNKDRTKKIEKLDSLKKVYQKYNEQAEARRAKFTALADSAGSSDSRVLALKQQLGLSELASARNDWVKLQADVRKLKVKIETHAAEHSGYAEQFRVLYATTGLPVNLVLPVVLEQRLKNVGVEGDVSPAALEKHMSKDHLLQRLVKNLEFAEGRLLGFKRTAEISSSTYAATLQQRETDVGTARRAIEQRKKDLYEFAVAEIRHQNGLQKQNTVYVLKKEMESLDRLEKMLKDDVNRLTDDSKTLNKSTLNLEGLKQEIKRFEDISHKVSREIDALDVERDAPARVTRFEDAIVYVPTKNSRLYMMTGMAGVGGLGLVLLGFAWLEFRSRRVDSPDEVVHDLGMKLLGTLPDFNRSRSRWLARNPDAYWENRLVNSVDAVRTTILYAAREENLKVVLVTSAVAGEGKTASASHLAASLARSGRRTVLVDCDLRNPSAHRLLEMSRAPGFSELLRGENTLAEITRSSNVDGLAVITAGQGDLEAIQALAQDKLTPVFEELRRQFDFVVIDSSPILPVPDALLIAQYADGVLFSILRDVSRMPKIVAALQRLSVLGIRVLGAIVNGTVDDTYGSRYGYGPAATSQDA